MNNRRGCGIMELEGLSLTKGCLAVAPKKVQQSSISFTKHPSETEKEAQRRCQKYQKCLTQIEGKIDDLMKEFEDGYHNDIKDYVSSVRQDLTLPRIPACVFNGGFDVSVNLFDKLKESLSSITSIIVNVQVYSSMKALMKDIFQQLLSLEEEAYTGSIPDCSISTICDWYRSYTISDAGQSPPPVVLVIECIESVPVPLLTELLLILHSRLQEFPVILLLGVRAVHNGFGLNFTPSILSVLKWDMIIKDPLQSIIPKTLEMLCFDSSLPFHFTPSFTHSLLGGFEGQLLPIANLKKSIQYHLLEHFYWQPLSFLCDSISSGTIRKDIKSLSKDQVEMIRSSPSMMSYVESVDFEERKALLQDDSHLKAKAEEFLKDIQLFYQSLEPAVKTLYILVYGKTSKDKLAKLKMLLSYITDSQGKDFYVQAVKLLDETVLQRNLHESITYITAACSNLSDILKALQDCLSGSKEGTLSTEHISTVIDLLMTHIHSPQRLTLHDVVCYDSNKMTPYHIL
ncbi:PREDICTED: origin recognition complex subunit 3-like isoform X2 [Amphimedon queenslandica]|uniref:Origin recognition complex subunit 3 n=1 Tax=Amphimedon queenslandica TaxID=400682 RepID=A0AAN0JGT0_AMPQE|nr:PREDICTED: origin recognition complex subunit 3-like isoform X2 [Amphimedon queenslandica]|eukprot:XP_019856169.1 PREDICTED: origin recognition complex subunit 3-like isoform X2 [Amphimedon queenslandica]